MLRSTTHELTDTTAVITVWDDDNRTTWTFELEDNLSSSKVKVSYSDPNLEDSPTKIVSFGHTRKGG